MKAWRQVAGGWVLSAAVGMAITVLTGCETRTAREDGRPPSEPFGEQAADSAVSEKQAAPAATDSAHEEQPPVELPVTGQEAAEEGVRESFLEPRQRVMGPLVNYYRPIRIRLVAEPQEELVAEPDYASERPLYGGMQLGNGSDNLITLVVDEAEGELPRIYVDRNNDEDLTNDGSGEWSRPGPTLGLSGVAIDVAYESGTIPYTFEFYRFTTRLRDFVLYYRNAGREGEITSGSERYKVVALDENADGRFDDLDHGTLIIDLNQDGKLVGRSDSAEHHKLNEPFNINGCVWEVASLSPDGTELQLRLSEASVEMKPYLDPGYPAPTFAGKDLDDNTIDLAQEAADAKYVLLDFWASWCGPCRREYPYLRRLHAQYKDHGLRIVGINLDSDRDKAVQAAEENLLTYPHVFDGGGWKNAVAVLYRVHGIPATYLLDQDLNILAKGLRGPTLKLRLTGLLGPGDTEAAAAVDDVMASRTSSTAPSEGAAKQDLSGQILPEADRSQLASAAFVLYATPDNLTWTKPLADILGGEDRRLPVARAAALEKAVEPEAGVLVLIMGRVGSTERNEEVLDRLKNRKVIGIGYGAAQLFGTLGLEIRGGYCAHGFRPPAEITIQKSGLLGEAKVTEPLAAFQMDRVADRTDVFAMHIPPKSHFCTVVDVLARWTNDANYAPVVRQGNHVLVGITTPATTWTPAFAQWFHELATALHSRAIEPFSIAKWETTQPGTYDFTLGRSDRTDELGRKTFYFRFSEPTVLSVGLEHKSSDAVALSFWGENGRHRNGKDSREGKPLELRCNITKEDIEDLGERYWILSVVNFDRRDLAECTLSIACE